MIESGGTPTGARRAARDRAPRRARPSAERVDRPRARARHPPADAGLPTARRASAARIAERSSRRAPAAPTRVDPPALAATVRAAARRTRSLPLSYAETVRPPEVRTRSG